MPVRNIWTPKYGKFDNASRANRTIKSDATLGKSGRDLLTVNDKRFQRCLRSVSVRVRIPIILGRTVL